MQTSPDIRGLPPHVGPAGRPNGQLDGRAASIRGHAGPRALLGSAILCAGVLLAGLLGGGDAAAQRPIRMPPAAATGQTGQFWTTTTPLDDGRQMLLLLDEQNRNLAIYHVDPAAGTLTLKSTRNIGWDLMIEDFNAQDPKPAALKKMLEMPK